MKGTGTFSLPQKVLLNDSSSEEPCHAASGNDQQNLTACTYCSYDATNVSGIKLTSSVIPDNSSNTSQVDTKMCDIPSSTAGINDNLAGTARCTDAKTCRRFRKLYRKRQKRNIGHLNSVSNYALVNSSHGNLTPPSNSLLSKGPSFVPTPKHIDWGKLSKD